MTVLQKHPEYRLHHIDPATGFGLLYSEVYENCAFLNPVATTLWQIASDSLDLERESRLFSQVFPIPDAAGYLRSVISDLQRNGLLIEEGVAPAAPPPRDRTSTGEYRLAQIYLYATKECNARCYHCYQPTIKVPNVRRPCLPSQIQPAAFTRLVEDAIDLGLQHVKITGGEALLRSDLFEIIRDVRALGIDVSMETNGYLIDSEVANLLAEYQVNVSISLDGGSAAIHDKLRGHPGSFDKVVQALRMLSDRGSDPKIIMSISRRNLDQVEPVIKVAVDSGSRLVKLNPVNTLGQAARLSATTFLLTTEDLIGLYRRRAELESRYDVFLYLEGPPAFASVFEIATGHSAICPFTNLLGVLSDGSLSFCGIGNTCQELVFGRVDDEGFNLHRLWREAPLLLDVRKLMSRKVQGVCEQCILEPFCKGSCRALAYGEYKEFLAPHPWCQIAFEDGLFPPHYLKRKEVNENGYRRGNREGVPGSSRPLL